MSEFNRYYIDEFKKFLVKDNYEIDEISESSILGIKNDLKFHMFYDYKYYEYCMYTNKNGFKLWASIFDLNTENKLQLNHKDDKRTFENLDEIIHFTLENSNAK